MTSRSLARLAARMTATAETLALFRMAVAFALLTSTELHAGVRYAALATEQRIAPEGLGWFVAIVAPGPAVAAANVVRAIAMGAAVATLLGVYTRVASAILAVTAFYLLSLGQLGGTVVHNMHLTWFAVILATSRSGDAWSVDAWWDARERGEPASPPPSSARYGVPVWTARALFACVYFFPGLHKILAQGLGWASAENLALQLHWKWFEWNHVPAFRLDHHPALLVAGGVATLVFELGFPLLLLRKETRVLAAAMGLGFHLATDHFMRIPFSSLWLCYPVLFDVGRRKPDEVTAVEAPPRLEIAIGAVLVALAVVQGARGKMDAFPFACYPTFAPRAPTEVPDLRVVVVRADGSESVVPHAQDGRGVRSQADWGRIWALVGATRPLDLDRLAAYGRALERAAPASFADAARVELRRAQFPVSPDADRRRPRSEQTLVTLPR